MNSYDKILIFGATGNTGLATVQRGLELGKTISVFVRDPSKLGSLSVNGKVFVGDVTNASDVENAIKDHDAVFIILGTRNNLDPTDVLSKGTQNIVNVMEDHSIHRVIACLSSFLFWEPDKIPERMTNIHGEHVKMLEILQKSPLDWTALCPPHIEECPSKGSYKLENEQRVGAVIAKADLADGFYKCLEETERIGQRVGIGY